MKRVLLVLSLGLAAACTRGRSAPVTPLPEPVTQQPAAAPQPQPLPASPADQPASGPATSAAADVSGQASATSDSTRQAQGSTQRDTLQQEAEFLDSLHSAAADTAHHPVMTVPVAPEAVSKEAATLFGRPGGAVASATWDIDVASYASRERVQYWMEYFTGRSRWHFERYIERSGRYDSIIRGKLAAAGMPQDMIYLAMIESGFAQNIRSRAGAVGLWQFMPSTGRRYGLTVDAWVDERRDPFIETDAAIRFLSELNNRFGSWYLAAAAYNGGPGRVERGLARGDYGALNGNDAFFAMAEGSRYFHRETRDYVPKLIAAALLAKEPEKYGFTGLDIWQPLRYDSLQTRFAVGMDVLARLSGTTTDAMEDLNPMYYRGVTPPDRPAWVRVPPGTAESVTVRLASLPEHERVTVLAHVVSRGETLSRVARRYGVSVVDIQTANNLRTNRLHAGQRLIIPTSLSRMRSEARVAPRETQTARTRSRTTRTAPATASRGAQAARTVSYARPVPAGASHRVHIVRQGESPYSIATSFHVPLSALLAANGLSARTRIHPGQSLRIPG